MFRGVKERLVHQTRPEKQFKRHLYDPIPTELRTWLNDVLPSMKKNDQYLRECIAKEIIPGLINDSEFPPSYHCFRLAVCSAFVHSFDLDTETRCKLGLPPDPEYLFPDCAPTLTNPYASRWTSLCDYSEEGFENIYRRFVDQDNKIEVGSGLPFVMYDSLIGKIHRIDALYCTNPQEFPNGTWFVPGNIYLIRDNTYLHIESAIKNIAAGFEDPYVGYAEDSSDDPARRLLTINPQTCEFMPIRALHCEEEVGNVWEY